MLPCPVLSVEVPEHANGAHLVADSTDGSPAHSDELLDRFKVLLGVLRLLQHMVWGHSQHLHYTRKQIVLRGAREEREAQEELCCHAAQ